MNFWRHYFAAILREYLASRIFTILKILFSKYVLCVPTDIHKYMQVNYKCAVLPSPIAKIVHGCGQHLKESFCAHAIRTKISCAGL